MLIISNVKPRFQLDGVEQEPVAEMISGLLRMEFTQLSDTRDFTVTAYKITVEGNVFIFYLSNGCSVYLDTNLFEIKNKEPVNETDNKILIIESSVSDCYLEGICFIDNSDLHNCTINNSDLIRSDMTKMKVVNSRINWSKVYPGGTIIDTFIEDSKIINDLTSYNVNDSFIENTTITGNGSLRISESDIANCIINHYRYSIFNKQRLESAYITGDSFQLKDIYSIFKIDIELAEFYVFENGHGGWGICNAVNPDYTHITLTDLPSLTQFVKLTCAYEDKESIIYESIAKLIWDSYISRSELLKRIRSKHVEERTKTA